jgi:hypothetical protein
MITSHTKKGYKWLLDHMSGVTLHMGRASVEVPSEVIEDLIDVMKSHNLVVDY